MTRLTLYPDIRPYVQHSLAVEPPHVLHVEECGNPDGIPVLFVHGGPGAGCEPYHRRFFDPGLYRIILFDQRGCGRSTPHAELDGNTTQALVADMEAIREHLGVERWMLFGGSWGSTLGLAYAETHPERVLGLILRGIFLCRPHEIRWFYQEGASRLFPDYWEAYLEPIPEAERGDLVRAYYSRLTSDDEVARMAAAKAWSLWEGRTASLLPREELVNHFADPFTALSLARIECHYFMHDSFLEPDQLLRDAHRLAGIPGIIVHGRYDAICPLENAWQLARAWPDAELQIIPDAGHAASEPGIVDALVRATNSLGRRVG
ncbi:prolyl aminopeptidase [Thioalbus denitrificans]|uniref:Proline iminopeptidase n=1 Tax=Thioalbus denitrificans TaxID=547122 RepID=A0A369CLD5_9GAMM|nr:prolyl aminopeptidase [Thioalbus denitrificans]